MVAVPGGIGANLPPSRMRHPFGSRSAAPGHTFFFRGRLSLTMHSIASLRAPPRTRGQASSRHSSPRRNHTRVGRHTLDFASPLEGGFGFLGLPPKKDEPSPDRSAISRSTGSLDKASMLDIGFPE